jgi:hypothetical protein
MILILTDVSEGTTDLVLDWIEYFGEDYIRISCVDSLVLRKIFMTKGGFEAVFEFERDGVKTVINTQEINSYWYRRSILSLKKPFVNSSSVELEEVINAYVGDEYTSAVKMLNIILNNKPKVNKFEDGEVDKIDVLQRAKYYGLKIPRTIICDTKKELAAFYFQMNGMVITKPIGDPCSLFKHNVHHYTTKIHLDKVTEKFGLSLFQEQIVKLYELRIFFVGDEYFATVIFSQSNEATKIDLKNYGDDYYSRVVPYELPPEIKLKLQNLMIDIGFNSGSIDMIVDTNKEYLFVEVNPLGQFEQVAFPFNVDLFKLMAETLIEKR